MIRRSRNVTSAARSDKAFRCLLFLATVAVGAGIPTRIEPALPTIVHDSVDGTLIVEGFPAISDDGLRVLAVGTPYSCCHGDGTELYEVVDGNWRHPRTLRLSPSEDEDGESFQSPASRRDRLQRWRSMLQGTPVHAMTKMERWPRRSFLAMHSLRFLHDSLDLHPSQLDLPQWTVEDRNCDPGPVCSASVTVQQVWIDRNHQRLLVEFGHIHGGNGPSQGPYYLVVDRSALRPAASIDILRPGVAWWQPLGGPFRGLCADPWSLGILAVVDAMRSTPAVEDDSLPGRSPSREGDLRILEILHAQALPKESLPLRKGRPGTELRVSVGGSPLEGLAVGDTVMAFLYEYEGRHTFPPNPMLKIRSSRDPVVSSLRRFVQSGFSPLAIETDTALWRPYGCDSTLKQAVECHRDFPREP